MANARIEFRLDEKLKAKIEKASVLSGAKNTTEYVIDLLEKDSEKVISQHESLIVKNDIFDRFMEACEKASKPNEALTEAVIYTKEQGIK